MQQLIAHRGEPEQCPENSLEGFRAVLAAGAAFVETDVQLTADLIPVLSHDDSLLRMTGRDMAVSAVSSAEVCGLSAGEPARFGERFNDHRIATLAELALLLVQWPDARAFIEIKPASIQAFGVVQNVDCILAALGEARAQCIPISFDDQALQYVKDHHGMPFGWVLPEWSDATRQRAEALAPDYLFVDYRRVPQAADPLWPGPWRWVAYTTNEMDRIEQLLALGFDLVETNDIRRLMQEFEKPAALPV